MSLKLTVSLAAKLTVPLSTSCTVVLLLVAGPIVTPALAATLRVAPDFTVKLPRFSALPLVMVMLLKAVLLLLAVRWPESVTVPAPIKVVPLSARVPVLLTEIGPSIVEVAAPRVSEPLATLTVVEEFVIKLRTESLGPVVTVPLVRSITAVSEVPGRTPPIQCPGVSHVPPVG